MILHVCCNLAGSTVFPQLFEALRDAGEVQQVFVPERRAGNMGKNRPAGIPVVQELTVRSSDMLFFHRKATRSVPVIRAKMDLSGVEFIHAHTLFTDGSIAMRLSQETGIPFGVTLRYSDIEAIWRWEPHLRPLGRRILQEACFVVFLGEASRQKVLGWMHGKAREMLANKSSVIPNGISPAWLDGKPRTGLHSPARVGFAGLLNARKHPLDAVTAVHLADGNGQHIALDICGHGPLEEKVRAALGLDDRFHGALSGMEAMKAFYAGIDVLLVPSSAETFGMVYLEAMSQGVPVLYTRGQGFDGLFPEGEVGRSVIAGNVRDQADAILEVVSGDYARMSGNCVRGAARCAWPEIARRWQAVYTKVRSSAICRD